MNTAQRWRNRFAKAQMISYEDLNLEERLQDGPRPGAPSRITADQRCQIEALACEKPEKSGRPISQWTAHEIADEVIERGNFTSMDELKRKVLAFIEYYNRTMAKPFKWIYQGKALHA